MKYNQISDIRNKWTFTARSAGKLSALALATALFATGAIFAQEPDNTKNNQQERAGAQTADQQSENTADRDLTKKIRRALVQDKSLSTYAHNVKIITRNGMVTLKGPVRSEEEKSAIEAKATEIAGQSKVKDELSVKEPKS